MGQDLERDIQAGIYIGILCMNVVVWEERAVTEVGSECTEAVRTLRITTWY